MMFLGDRLHGVLQDTVNAVLYGYFRITRLNVNITSAPFERRENDGFDQANYGTGRAIPRQAITGDGLFGFLLLLGRLEGKRFRGLFQNPLRLLGALQQVADLASGCNTNQKFLDA